MIETCAESFRDRIVRRVADAMNEAIGEPRLWTNLECHMLTRVVDDITMNFGMYTTAWNEADR